MANSSNQPSHPLRSEPTSKPAGLHLNNWLRLSHDRGPPKTTAPQFCGPKNLYETAPTAAPISTVRFRHSTKSAARLSTALNAAQFVCSGICGRSPHCRVSDRKIAARCPDIPRDQVEC